MRKTAALALAWAATAWPLAATPEQTFVPQAAEARRATTAIVLDGHLDDRDWASAPALTRMWEVYPTSQIAAPELTETRFLYDDRFLYVGFRLFLKDPSTLRKPYVRRDKVGSTHDYVQIYLDPQGSGQTSTLFRINARGTQTDGVQDEAKQTESTDPDFEWEERSAVDAGGWTAELRIPLSTLRVSGHGRQMWNVVVTRGVPRDQNTQMATAPWPQNVSCFLCLASKLSFPDLRASRERLIVEPSFATKLQRDTGSFGHGTKFDLQPSLDAKWLPFNGAAVDLTVNPDFSQVEADSPQLSADQRFAINLPEKRPFFREGSDLINTPLPVLYTRTITAPDYGLRFTQRSASFNGTVFAAVDGGRGVIIEPGLLASTAVVPDFDSKVGFAHATERAGSALLGALTVGKFNDDGSYNAVGGIDGAWQSSTDRFTAQLLTSRTRNPDRPDLVPGWQGQKLTGAAGIAQWDHTSSFVSTLRYTRYDPGFRSWLGFVPRVGFDSVYGYLRKDFYPSSLSPIISRVGPYVSYERLNAIGEHGTEQDATLGVLIDATKASYLDVSWHPAKQIIVQPGQERRFGQVNWTFQMTPGARIPVVRLNGTVGHDVDYADGTVVPVVNLEGALRLQPMDPLQLELRYTTLRLGGAPGGGSRVTESIPEFLATWFFGPSFYAFADVQLHRSERRFPSVTKDRSSLASVQVVWEPRLDWRGYVGVRYGRLRPLDPTQHGSSTEIYVKLVRRFGMDI